MKFQRQSKLIELIERHDIETQEELSDRLRDLGYGTTQATISRDIKELRLIKTPTGHNTYKYAVAPDDSERVYQSRLRSIFREAVVSSERAQNIIVIKTLPGLANAACAALDTMRVESLAGTLAGDDTAFLLLRDNESAEAFLREIEALLC